MEIMKNVGADKSLEAEASRTGKTLFATIQGRAMEMGSDIMVQKSHSEKEAYELSLDV